MQVLKDCRCVPLGTARDVGDLSTHLAAVEVVLVYQWRTICSWWDLVAVNVETWRIVAVLDVTLIRSLHFDWISDHECREQGQDETWFDLHLEGCEMAVVLRRMAYCARCSIEERLRCSNF